MNVSQKCMSLVALENNDIFYLQGHNNCDAAFKGWHCYNGMEWLLTCNLFEKWIIFVSFR